jgi:hypothetical protein
MPNGYPPGVTGNEPHITGEVEFYPHQPFWVGDDPDEDGKWAVYFEDGEGIYFTGPGTGWRTADHAQSFADRLNARYGFRECLPDHKRPGWCRICGDLIGEPE